jgi:hypothetical protein
MERLWLEMELHPISWVDRFTLSPDEKAIYAISRDSVELVAALTTAAATSSPTTSTSQSPTKAPAFPDTPIPTLSPTESSAFTAFLVSLMPVVVGCCGFRSLTLSLKISAPK